MIKTVSEASASTNEEEEEEEEEGRVKQPTNKKESESVFLYRNVVERESLKSNTILLVVCTARAYVVLRFSFVLCIHSFQ